jgi:hypothetical protein
MASSNTVYSDKLDKALEAVPGGCVVSAEDLKAMAMFIVYLVNLLEDHGLGYRGHSLRETGALTLLVVRATAGDDPVCCFISARTSLDCIVVFLRQLDEHRLGWRHDKFA